MRKYKLVLQYDIVDIDGDYILTPKNESEHDSTDAIILNTTDFEMFQSLVNKLDVDSIISEFSNRYDVEKSVIATDLDEIILELKSKNLIKEI